MGDENANERVESIQAIYSSLEELSHICELLCVVRATNAKGWAAQVMADVVAENCRS